MNCLRPISVIQRKWHAEWLRLFRDQAGQDMIEYALMAAVIAVVSAAALPGLAPPISTVFSKIGSMLTLAGGGS